MSEPELVCKGNLLWESSKRGFEARFFLLWENRIETWVSEADCLEGGRGRANASIALNDIVRVDMQKDCWTLHVSHPNREAIKRVKAMEGHDISEWTSHLGRLIPNKVSWDCPKVVLTI